MAEETATRPDSAAAPGASPPWRRAARAIFSAALVTGIFVGVLPRLAAYSDVWATLLDVDPLALGALLVVTALSVASYWLVLVASLPGLRYPQAAAVNLASTAVANTLPGGGALAVGMTYAMCASWGFGAAPITLSVLVTGIWNGFVKFGLPIVALALLAIDGRMGPSLLAPALMGLVFLVGTIALFGAMLASDRVARRVGAVLGRGVDRLRGLVSRPPVQDWATAAEAFRRRSIGLLRTRWLALTLATVASHIALFWVLLVSLRQLGVSGAELSWIQVLAAFALVRLVSALPITPGGAGVVELGFAALLAFMNEAVAAQVVAAVLVFRFLTYFLPIPTGAAAYLLWRRAARRQRPGAAT